MTTPTPAEPQSWFVEIEGGNFLVDHGDGPSQHGFIAMRFVEAPDAKTAELAAVQSLRDDQSLRDLVRNESADPPVMDVTKVVPIEASDRPDEQSGLIWYPVRPKRWWQFWRRGAC